MPKLIMHTNPRSRNVFLWFLISALPKIPTPSITKKVANQKLAIIAVLAMRTFGLMDWALSAERAKKYTSPQGKKPFNTPIKT